MCPLLTFRGKKISIEKFRLIYFYLMIGGSYGYVQYALHPFIGYLVGFAEAVEYIMYVAVSVLTFEQMMNVVCATPDLCIESVMC
jgi:amino acid transporter